ncbi:MAG: hypothetical protein ABIW79_08000 [Gemmatimonas sp.]
MTQHLSPRARLLAAAALSFLGSGTASAQLGRQQGLVEPNVAADSTMLALPGMAAHTVDALKSARPVLSAVVMDSILASHTMSKAQRTALYSRMFVHVDVNRGTDAETMLIPGMDAKRLAALKAGRPYMSFDAFAAAMTKASNASEAARLEQYFFIPIELNTWTDPIMDSFASIGVGTRQWKREFAEYRPWKSMEQFERDIGKYLRARPAELTRLQRYVIINP